MKRSVFLLLLLPCFATAQHVLLLDRNLKAAIILTQTPTREQLTGQWFPIETQDLDSVIRIVERLAGWADMGVEAQEGMQIMPAGHSHVAVWTARTNGSNVFGVSLSTRLGDVGASMELVKRGTGGRQTARQLLRYLDYMKNNRHMAVR